MRSIKLFNILFIHDLIKYNLKIFILKNMIKDSQIAMYDSASR